MSVGEKGAAGQPALIGQIEALARLWSRPREETRLRLSSGLTMGSATGAACCSMCFGGSAPIRIQSVKVDTGTRNRNDELAIK